MVSLMSPVFLQHPLMVSVLQISTTVVSRGFWHETCHGAVSQVDFVDNHSILDDDAAAEKFMMRMVESDAGSSR